MGTRLPLRVVLVYKGVKRKFFSLFTGRDNSFYIHLYRPHGQPWRIPGADFNKKGEHGALLDFEKFSEPGFGLHKITFHKSGYIHLTDKQARRYRNGVRGPAFEDVSLPYDLCLLVPCSPEMLPAHEGGRAFVAEVVLPNEIGPFYASLTLISTSAPSVAAQGPLIVQPVSFLFPGFDHSIALTMWPVREMVADKVPDWPPFPFFILRTGA
jgi:hypothetical protein